MARKKGRQEVEGLRSLSDDDLAKELEEAYRQLFTVRLQLSTRQLSNTAEASKVKRKIARIKTVQREREFVAFYEAAAAGAEQG
jgi:large subunit ribosomal protein L29